MTAAGFAGAVLCGGASRRMGRDKALIEIDGLPMAARVAAALHAAGADPVVALGGDAAALARLGLGVVPDDEPGGGPLPAVLTSLGLGAPASLVVACDLVAPSAGAMRATVDALAARPDADVAVPVHGGYRHWAHAAWRRSALPALAAARARGVRSIRRAAAELVVVELTGLVASALADADTPEELAAVTGDGGHDE